MKLRLQHFLVIVPLFAAFGIGSALLAYRQFSAELRWGAEARASSAATAVAAHLDGKVIESILRGRELEPEAYQQLQERIRRLARWDVVRHLMIVGAADGKNMIDFESDFRHPVNRDQLEVPDEPRPQSVRGDSFNGRPALTATLRALLEKQAVATSSHFDREGNEGALWAYAPVRNSHGMTVAYVAAESEILLMLTRLDAIARQLLWMTLSIIVLGFIAAEVLTRTLCRRMKELTHRAVRLVSGFRPAVSTSIISELRDLDDTFETMGEILDATLEKARRKAQEAESERSEDDLLRSFNRNMLAGWSETTGQGAASVILACETSREDIIVVHESADTVQVVLARISAADLRTSLQERSTFQTTARALLVNGSALKAVVTQLEKLFAVEQLEAVEWQSTSGIIVRYRLDASRGVIQENEPVNARSRYVLNSLSGSSKEDLQRCQRILDREDEALFISAVTPAIHLSPHGAVVSLQPGGNTP